MKWILLTLLPMFTACSLQPITNVDSVNKQVQVEISSNQFVDLPLPEQLQQTLNVSQLITAQWGEGSKQKLLVQLQVDQQQVVLAGFSAWGVKLLSLNYVKNQTGNQIETSVMTGLGETLPSPEQVLFNVMLAIWPNQAWQAPLDNIGWRLQETELQRLLLDQQGDVVISIDYQKTPYLDGTITFKHHRLHYTILIETKR